jgi:hypothetical protein
MSREFATVVLPTPELIEAAKTSNKNNNPDSGAYNDANASQLNNIGENDLQGHNLIAVTLGSGSLFSTQAAGHQHDCN